MIEKNEREKKGLYEWACNNESKEMMNKIFNCASEKNMDSYYSDYPERDYLMEYHPQSLPELDEFLDMIWDKDDVVKKAIPFIRVASMKNSPIMKQDSIGETSEKIEKTDSEPELPGFIYNF